MTTTHTNNREDTMDRKLMAAELLDGCPDESLADHQEIAAAIARGDSLETILAMPVLNEWPDTYVWVKYNLS